MWEPCHGLRMSRWARWPGCLCQYLALQLYHDVSAGPGLTSRTASCLLLLAVPCLLLQRTPLLFSCTSTSGYSRTVPGGVRGSERPHDMARRVLGQLLSAVRVQSPEGPCAACAETGTAPAAIAACVASCRHGSPVACAIHVLRHTLRTKTPRVCSLEPRGFCKKCASSIRTGWFWP